MQGQGMIGEDQSVPAVETNEKNATGISMLTMMVNNIQSEQQQKNIERKKRNVEDDQVSTKI